MTTQQIRDKFVEFFKQHGHVELPSSSLIPTDPTVLFTTAGMQQFKEWFVKPELAKHKRVVTIQPCFRTSDIEEVGDATHLTYFEMLGHFSFGDYFKKEAIEWGWSFLTKGLGINSQEIRATYFGGDPTSPEASRGKRLPADTESLEILKQYLPEDRIESAGKEDNFWGPTGDEGPCGPNIEFHVRDIEIWNAVFNQYYFNGSSYEALKTPGVDMGGGLERIAMVVQGVDNVFETDELAKVLAKIPEGDLRSRRIIADHTRAINAMIKDGVEPSNKAQGAVLRRLIRRVITHSRLLGAKDDLLLTLLDKSSIPVAAAELEKFSRTLSQAMRIYSNVLKNIRKDKRMKAEDAFLLQESYGLPFELTQELARKDGYVVDKEGFEKLMQEHRQKSRAGVEGKFKGGLVEITPETTRLHTAHHLLLAALRKVLGDHVVQRGSNITGERLRIDFSHIRGVKPEELQKVEDLVNQWIKDDLVVTREEMALGQAIKKGALGEFGATYPERVSVYSIGPHSAHPSPRLRPASKASRGDRPVSVEICGGPHVSRTSEISKISKNSKFRITKEESSGAGVRRMRAVLD